MTMTRSLVLNSSCLQYVGPTPKSVVIILHDTPQIGSDKNLLENILFISRLKNSVDNPQRVVLIPQLPAGQTDFWGNTVGPVISYALANWPTLPIDFVGWGKGANNLPSNLAAYTSNFRSLGAVQPSPNFDYSDATCNLLKLIYSIFGTSEQMSGSTDKIYPVTNKLANAPFSVANYVCEGEWMGLTAGAKTQADCISQFFTGIFGDGTAGSQYNIQSYWSWLDSVVDADVAHLRTVPVKSIYVTPPGGTKTKIWDGPTQGDPIKVEIY